MSLQSWQETLIANVAVGPTITATTISSILPPDCVYTLPANFFSVGKKMRIIAVGQTTTTVTTPGTKIFTVNFGGIAVFTSPAMALNIVAGTYSWKLELLMNCTAIGSGTLATIKTLGMFTSDSVIGSAAPGVGGVTTMMLPNGPPVNGPGFSSVTSQAVDLLVTNSVNDGEILHGYRLESFN